MKSVPRRFGLRFLFVLVTLSCIPMWWYTRVPTVEHLAKRFPVAKEDELKRLLRKLPNLTEEQRADFFESSFLEYSIAQKARLKRIAKEWAEADPDHALDWITRVYTRDAMGDFGHDADLDPNGSLLQGFYPEFCEHDAFHALILLQHFHIDFGFIDLAAEQPLYEALNRKSFAEVKTWFEENWPHKNAVPDQSFMLYAVEQHLHKKDPAAYLDLLPRKVGNKPYRWIDVFSALPAIEDDCFVALELLAQAYPEPPRRDPDSFGGRQPIYVDNGYPIDPNHEYPFFDAAVRCLGQDAHAFAKWADEQPHWRFNKYLTRQIIEKCPDDELESLALWLRTKVGKWSGIQEELFVLFNRMLDEDADRIAPLWADLQDQIEGPRTRYEFVFSIAHNRFLNNPAVTMAIVDRLPDVNDERCPESARDYFGELWEERDPDAYQIWQADR